MQLKRLFSEDVGVKMSGIVDNFSDILNKYTDAPEIFIKASAYSIVSSTLGPFYNILNARNIKANLYIVLASPPGLGRRSEVMKLTNLVKETAFKKYVELKGGELENENFIGAISLESGSPQGLIDDILAYKEKGVFSYCLTSTEFGNAVLKTINKNFRQGFESLLCKLWGGEPHTDSLSHREGNVPRYLPRGTYFGIYAGMQKAEHYLDKSMSNSGLLRRLLIASVKGADLDAWYPPLGSDNRIIDEELITIGEKIGEKMASFDRVRNIKLDDDAMHNINKDNFHAENDARNNDENPYYLQRQSYWEQILKISANDSISNNQEKITIDNVKRAVLFVEMATKNMRSILENLLVTELQLERQRNLDRILKLIRKRKTKREIQQALGPYGVRGNEFQKLINILIEEGKIEPRLSPEGRFVLT